MLLKRLKIGLELILTLNRNMVTTINNENYVKGTQQMSGKLFVDVTLVSFLNKDGRIVVYNNIGEIVTRFDEALQEEITEYKPMHVIKRAYTQDEMKTLIAGTGSNFNDLGTNLLLDEINKFVDDIILNDITENPSEYFGLSVEKWTK